MVRATQPQPPRQQPPEHLTMGCGCLLLALAASLMLCSAALLAWTLGMGGAS